MATAHQRQGWRQEEGGSHRMENTPSSGCSGQLIQTHDEPRQAFEYEACQLSGNVSPPLAISTSRLTATFCQSVSLDISFYQSRPSCDMTLCCICQKNFLSAPFVTVTPESVGGILLCTAWYAVLSWKVWVSRVCKVWYLCFIKTSITITRWHCVKYPFLGVDYFSPLFAYLALAHLTPLPLLFLMLLQALLIWPLFSLSFPRSSLTLAWLPLGSR